MTDQANKDFNSAVAGKDGYVDPSIAYAEAVMNGDRDVTVQGRDGQSITYQIGREYNYTNK